MADPLGLTGNKLGGYDVEEFISSGAFAFVYAASRPGNPRRFALKILNPSAGAQQILEFENEGSLLFKLSDCSGVVDILESLEEPTVVTGQGGLRLSIRLRFHVLGRADGCLTELLADVSSLDWPSRLSLFRGLVLGVHQMHLRSIVHRDLKAANALLYLTGGGVAARISDLGRSRDLGDPASVPPLVYRFTRGDPDFTPPEFLWYLGEDTPLGHRCADLYGLGSMLFELTLGHGLTSAALFPLQALIVPDLSLSDHQRAQTYRARLAEVRAWLEPHFQLFEQAAPSAIRPQAGQLLRQLCDPDPAARLPRVRPGHRAPRQDELNWLLNRVDMLRLTIRNSLRQQETLMTRKGVRA